MGKQGKKKILSVILTLMVIGVLLLSGPASAVTVGLTQTGGGNGVYTYRVSVDLHSNDHVSLDFAAVRLTKVSDSSFDTCYFNFDDYTLNGTYGSNAGGPCKMVQITSITNNALYSGSAGYAYGYGYSQDAGWGLNNVSWSGVGYGYSAGYGYSDFTEDTSSSGEVIIEFTVDTTVQNGPDSGSQFTLKAGVAGLESNQIKYTYYNKEDSSPITVVGGGGDNYNQGLSEYESSIVSPYMIKNVPKLMNFSIVRNAGDSSCLTNLTISLPENITYNWYNDSNIDASNYTLIKSGNNFTWKATGTDFFCGRGPYNFILNLTSTRVYGQGKFQVVGYASSGTSPSAINLSFFTTTIFSYNGTAYDANGQPLAGTVASIAALSFGQNGDLTLGTFSDTSDGNGIFNITDIPGLNVSMEDGSKGPGDNGGIFYRLSASLYNDSDNHYAMYTGPSLPELPESELRSVWGLSNPEIYLKPALSFHIRVDGRDFKSGPTNNNMCNESGCLDDAFNWTYLDFSYGLKDSKLGYPVTSDYSTRTDERYFAAPRDRNYSLMVFPDSSFPIYASFNGIESKCNTSGYNLSVTGVSATCTIQHGTYFVDAVITAAQTMTQITGYINITNVSDFWIVPYMFSSGSMLFDQDTLPFNMGQMMRWPTNDSLYDDYYNKSSGYYRLYLPATETSSSIMLMAFAKKGDDYYNNIYKLDSEGQAFNVSQINFSMNQLVTGVSKTISSNNVSQQWNSTNVVNTTAVQFSLVNNGTLLSTESSFVEIKLEQNGIEFMRMMNAQSGVFTLPLISGESIKKLTVYSQSYAPVSTPVSASILAGNTRTETLACSGGECNISLTRFDPFDPNDPNATLDVMMDFYKSNSSCDVPNPDSGCQMTGGANSSTDDFSPLKAILMGDVSLRIRSGDISVHYVKTDLLASGPPDAAFSQNSSGSDLNAAWKFGSKGPEIYDYVLISMPYASTLDNKSINISIPILYDNDFNVIWNISVNTTSQLIGTDYGDYLGSDYESYLNGSGVICSTNDSTLSSSLCYKDTTINALIWLKIPHFSGVGPTINEAATTTTATTTTTTSTSSSSGTGGTTPALTVTAAVSKMWSVVKSGEETQFNINNAEVPFLLVAFTTGSDYNNVNLDVSALVGKPSSLPLPEGTVYSYLEIDASNLPNSGITSARIQFKVPLSWFDDNDLDTGSVTLLRYNSGWQTLETTMTKTEGGYVYFEAITPGFSYFAIKADKKTTATVETEETPAEEETQPITTTEGQTEETIGKETGISLGWLWWVIGIVIIVALAIYMYVAKQGNKGSEDIAQPKEEEPKQAKKGKK